MSVRSVMFGVAATGLALIPSQSLAQSADAALTYGISSSNTPRHRTWTGSAWTSESNTAAATANPRWMVVREGPKRGERIAVCGDAGNQLTATVYNGSAWGSATTLSANLATSNERPYYVAYEQSSGDAMVAYRVGNAATLYYRIWNGTSWSAQSSVAISGAGYPTFIKLVPDPSSDEIVAIVLDTSNDLSAMVWSGSSWGNAQLLDGSGVGTEECADATYESVAGRCMVTWTRSGSSTPRYRIWTGSAWLAQASMPAIGTGIPQQFRLAADPVGNKIIAVMGNNQNDLYATVWSGSAWGAVSTLTTSAGYNICRGMDVSFEPGGTRAVVAYSRNYMVNWAYRKQITIDDSMVSGGSDLTNFPLLISLASDANLAAGALSSGDDILFTSSDGVTKLDHEIETYVSGTGELEAWVRIPTLSASSDTVLYMYYGNPSASNQQNVPGVWSNGYRGVWHLNGNANDSTSNDNDGTISGATSIGGRVGNALNFNNTSHYVWVPNDATLQLTTALTLEGWGRMRSFGNDYETNIIVRKGDDNPNNYELTLYENTGYFVLDGGDNGSDGPRTGTLSTNTWYHFAGTWNGSTERIFLNGSQINTMSKSSPIGTDTRNLYIGGRSGNTDVCDGYVDEVRISNVARSSGWLMTQYRNMNSPSSYDTVGSQTSMANIYYTVYDGSSWSAAQTGPATTVVPNCIQLCPSKSGSDIYLAASRADRSLMFMRWNGTSFVDSQSLSAALSGSVLHEPFMLTSRSKSKVVQWAEVEPTP